MSVPPSQRFEKFCAVSRLVTRDSKKKYAGTDGLLFDGEFQVGSMPTEYALLERALFNHQNNVDDVVGPIQTHVDAFHLAYIVDRWDPLYEKTKSKGAKNKKGKKKGTKTTQEETEEPKDK